MLDYQSPTVIEQIPEHVVNKNSSSNVKLCELNIVNENNPVPAYFSLVYPEAYPRLLKKFDDFLHMHEKEYLKKKLHERRKRSYLMGRYAAKLATAEYLKEQDLSSIEIRRGTFDQPIVRHRSFETPEITLSHCRHVAAAISYPAGHYMGVDVEGLDISKKDVFRGQLTDRERQMHRSAGMAKETTWNVIWTIKEAVSKTIKVGLTTPFVTLEISSLQRLSDGGLLCHFKNFAQYKCYSWIAGRWILSIAMPKNSELVFASKNISMPNE
jgi:4'-phosphopantetheinyl transferase